MHQKGFTLVELVIVFSIIALLSITGLASFAAFSQRQQLNNAVADLRTILNVARTRTLSQVNGSTSNYCTAAQQFGGYAVVVCCNDHGSGILQSGCPIAPPCIGSEDYDLYEACVTTNGSTSNTSYVGPIQTGNFPSKVVVATATTARTFLFTPITGAVSYGPGASQSSGAVTLQLISSSQSVTGTVTVTSVGAIQ